MEVKEINQKEAWENFLSGCEEKSFLSSWNWGEFEIKMGNKIWRLGIYDKKNLVGVALVSKIKARRGTFLLIQHGPAFAEVMAGNASIKYETMKALLEELKKIGKEERAAFIRMAPLFKENEENKKLFQDLGFRKSPMHASAYSATWKLNILIPEEELLKNMRKTTRYLIHQVMKNPDITIEKSEKLSDAEIYQKLNKEVSERQKFTPFSYEYVKNEFEVFSRDKESLLLFGKYKEEVVAGVLVIFWSGIGFYHQAASLAKHAKLSIPYLLQWEAIKEAKKRGCTLYDFWGFTDPKREPKHPWAGPTLFKMGFGGEAFKYVKTRDFPLSNKYWLTYIFERLRKAKRSL